MSIDIDALGSYTRRAEDGASAAADALSRISGANTVAEHTGITVATDRELRRFGSEHVGITIGLQGAFPGTLLLACDRAGAQRLLEPSSDSPPSAPLDPMDRSSAKEAAHIAADAYVEGFSAGLDGPVELAPPTYHDRLDEAPLLADAPGTAALVFESELVEADGGAAFSLLAVPGRAAVDDVFTARDPDAVGVPLHTLATFDRIARDGAGQAADLLSTMTGIEATPEASRLGFVPVETVSASVGDAPVAGTVFGLNDGRDGYLAVLFDESDALAVADAMLPVNGGDAFDEMTASALKELGSVLTSGFVEGWADVFDNPVDYTSPAFVTGSGDTVLDPILRRVGSQTDHAFVVETRMRTAAGFDCDVFALPADHRFTERPELRQSGRN